MTKPTKIRAKAVNGIVDFRMLMRHEMESGLEKIRLAKRYRMVY